MSRDRNQHRQDEKSTEEAHTHQHSRDDSASLVTQRPVRHSNKRMRSPRSNPIQILRLAFVTIALLALIVSMWHVTVSAADAAKPSVPVLIELFTSEGCSSCPPADDLLARLDTQPLPGVHAIVLSEHVTYWNQDGWHDPFSLDAITDRQRQYGSRFNLSDVFTPQAVIDGAAQVVGSDAGKLGQAITKAAAAPKSDLAIANAQWSNGAMQFTVKGNANPDANLFAALAEDSEQISVLHGENGGRTLHHVAVVRTLEQLGKASADAKSPMNGKTLTLHISKDVAKETTPLRLVVFLADRHNGHVLAVTEQTIPRS